MSHNIIFDESVNAYVREGTFDKAIVQEQRYYLDLGIKEGDAVLDIGANIGAFTRFAFKHGARIVHAVEPDPSNLEVLRLNTDEFWPSVLVFEGAVVAATDERREIPLYLNEEGTNKAIHSTIEHRGRPHIMVEAFAIDTIMLDGFNVVKIDIEGAEFEILPTSMPNSVRAFAIEYHVSRKGYKEKAAELNSWLVALGFKSTKPFEFSPKQWAKMLVYLRGE